MKASEGLYEIHRYEMLELYWFWKKNHLLQKINYSHVMYTLQLKQSQLSTPYCTRRLVWNKALSKEHIPLKGSVTNYGKTLFSKLLSMWQPIGLVAYLTIWQFTTNVFLWMIFIVDYILVKWFYIIWSCCCVRKSLPTTMTKQWQ